MIAVVGLGAWGMRHVATLLHVVGARRIVGVDPSPARRAMAADLGVMAVPHLDDLGAVDAAVVATPAHLHTAPALALIERGIHVLVEKPLAADLGEAAMIVERADRRGLVLMVGHVYLFHPGHEVLAQLVRDLGPVRSVVLQRRTPGLVKDGSDAWTELAPHELAAAIDLGALDAPVIAQGRHAWSATGVGGHDGAIGWYTTMSCSLTLECSWLGAARMRSMWVVAEGGQAMLDDDGQRCRVASMSGDQRWTVERPPAPLWREVPVPTPPLERELRAFLAACSSPGSPPVVRSSGEIGRRVVELMVATPETAPVPA